ncbi:IF-2B-domain-containing protein [Westerdykella ornata]|uniref:Translation initiation factor eIF2B subunit delta n=1 Tax=Westerdykella ornata TaxID=318751 RepID=A0A6A6J8T6_WESOR|nr:IF-2B-domain-containing protein [Westerdykella ornata]KAF2272677.1 IF-2B-domain-containing protein [Westerdykella ornata]
MSEPVAGNPVQASDTTNGASAPPPETGATNGSQTPSSAGAPAPGPEPKKLSAAELKKQKQAEKQARRAQAKAAGPPETNPREISAKESQKQVKDSKQASKDGKSKPTPPWRRPSQPTVPVFKDAKKEAKDSTQGKKLPGLFFGHLYTERREHSVTGATKGVHPAVLALGLQYSSYEICGSTARLVAMLLAFKPVIETYETPEGTSLARHFISHQLSPQIDYLRSCRPLSVGMSNAIRWLKDVIIKIDPATAEEDAKRDILSSIDDFIRDRVTVADKLIEEYGEKKIEDGDVILTYAASSIVEKTLIRAHKAGRSFSVIVVDSKPLFEGKRLARKLAYHGLSVKYFLITGASHAVKQASKVFLGAHAMMSNGRLYSRVGTAGVAMLAHAQSLPVIVLCESVKFTERVALDSIVGNELAPAEELLSESERKDMLPLKPYLPSGLLARLGAPEGEGDGEKRAEPGDVVKWIEGAENLQMLQVLYDVTPAEYIDIVVTEHGSLPPTSVPVVQFMSTDKK